MADMYHPWRAFRGLTDWTLRTGIMPAGVVAVTCWDDRTVTLDARLRQVERRCAIAHELQHIERGPALDTDADQEREEVAAERESARRLISLHALGEALAWSEDEWTVAAELWVDVTTLRARLEHLHPAERAYLHRRLDHEL